MKFSIPLFLICQFFFIGIQAQDNVTIAHTEQFELVSEYAPSKDIVIKVFLPYTYHKDENIKFPVLYLTDADVFFGAATDLSYFVDYGKPSHITVGISYGSFEQGWGQGAKRNLDFYSDKFIDFFEKELIPKIESKYRVDPSKRIFFGWSAGGYFGANYLFTKTDLFQNYILAGIPLIPRLGLFEKEQSFYEKNKALPVKLFMAVGGSDQLVSPDRFKEFVNIIERRKYEDLMFTNEVFERMGHNYSTAISALEKGLVFILKGHSIYELLLKEIEENGIDTAIALYRSIKTNNPEDYILNENELDNLGNFLIKQNKLEEAITIYSLNLETYPNSARGYFRLGEAYSKKGVTKLAIKNYELSLENTKNENRRKMTMEVIEKLKNKD